MKNLVPSGGRKSHNQPLVVSLSNHEQPTLRQAQGERVRSGLVYADLRDQVLAVKDRLLLVYERLFDAFGPQHWWPGETPFEVIIGAILTQSAAWGNVEKAISNLKRANALDPGRIRDMPLQELALLLYPSGYYNAKAKKVKAFVQRLGEQFQDELGKLLALDEASLREELLSIYGIGEETADSIMLYAAGHPTFVVDAYSRRIVSRLGLAPAKESYRSYQGLFTVSLPKDTGLFNEYHALLVRLGKEVCRKEPLCAQCCLKDICPTGLSRLRQA